MEAITGLYGYHRYNTALPVIRQIGGGTIPFSLRACEQLRHFECDGIIAFAMNRWRHDCCEKVAVFFVRPESPMKDRLELGTSQSENRYLSHHAQTMVIAWSLSFEHHAGDSTILLASTSFSENALGGNQGLPTSLLLPPTSQEDLRLDGYLKYSYAVKALFIYKHPCLLRDLNPVPTVAQSASLTTILDGRRVST
ncbi:uncharacterized protein TNCV_1522531 [Trichonephila clavipes]|nr:uncharacterized protein TNCV_1522531 [Trichonephila clavipes]